MLLRAHPSVVLLICAWGVFLLSLSWLGCPTSAQADDLSIRFEELESHIRAKSPRSQILEQELVKIRAERDDALQWSNPEIAYGREDVEADGEWQITLQKGFLAPFSQGKRRASWSDRIRSAELRIDQERWNLLADFKSGYVRLRLLEAYLSRLEQLEEITRKASAAAENRYNEGELSGTERDLIQLMGFSIGTNRLKVLQERRDVESAWRAEVGIPSGDHVELITPIGYEAVDLPSSTEYVGLLDTRPGIRSRMILGEALRKQAEAAQPSLLPGINLYAGYKQIEPERDGWVAGLGLSLPIFDRNAGASRESEAEAQIVKNELLLYRTRSAGEIAALIQMIEETQPMLATIAGRIENTPPILGNLLYAYREGQVSLDEFLNAIQIEMTGYQDYYDQLAAYYINTFRLEAITGTTIVSFAP